MIQASARPRRPRGTEGRRRARGGILAALLLVVCLPARPARAGSNYWQSIGPDGGFVISLVVDPSSPNTVYAGLTAGIYKSTDGGAHWVPSINGLGRPEAVALAIDPTTPSVLYLGTHHFSAFKSTDHGATWAAASTGLTGKNVWAIVVDPQDSRNVYVGTEAGIFKSHDAAATWAPAGTGLPTDTVFALAIDPSSPGTLYAGTKASGVYRTTDGAGTWNAASTGLTQSKIFSLAVDPVQPSNVYAGTVQGVFRTTDGASSWSATNAANDPINAMAVDPTTPSRVYAADAFAGVLRSEDAGQSWTPTGSGLPGDGVNALAINPSASGNVYAGVIRGVYKTADHGDSWTASFTSMRGLTTLSLAVDPATPATVYAGTNAGFYESLDQGATWTHPTNGLGEVNVYALLIAPGTPEQIFAGADGGVFRSQDGGTTWTPVLRADSALALAADPSTPSTLYAGGATDGSTQGFVYQSLDGGTTWASFGPSTPALPPVNALAVPPSGGDAVVYAGTDAGGYAAVEKQGALSWLTNDALSSITVFSIAIDPSSPSTLFLGTNSGLLKSTDGGKTFQPIDPNASGLQSQFVFALLFDPSAPGTFYAGTFNGFFVSTDGGASWTDLNEGLAATKVFSIAAGPTPILYAGLNGASVFQYGKPDLTPCASGPYGMCLSNNRFRVIASWVTPDGRSGPGMEMALTRDTGYFWFFSSDNVELIVKILDGTGVNGHFWVFYGALSNVQYTITIRDTLTGIQKVYVNPQGNLASAADTTAFVASGASSSDAGVAGTGPPVGPVTSPPAAACGAGPGALCLESSRFRAEVSWQTPDGRSGSGQAVPLSDDTGYFWFFSSGNVELVVKVLDGRAVNGHFWVFYGALSNVAYTITVTDIQTGSSKPYVNPQGTLASVADTAAF